MGRLSEFKCPRKNNLQLFNSFLCLLPRIFRAVQINRVFVASDFDRNKLIYEIELSRWIEYINFISSDSVCEVSMRFNEKKSDYTSILKEKRITL